MNIGLTQRILHYKNVAYDSTEHGWYNLLENHTLFVIPNNTKINIESIVDNLDMLIITGGLTDHRRNYVETKLLTQCYIKNKMILGVCHGAFFLNEMEQGRNNTIENHYGYTHSLTLEGEEFSVNSFHTTGIEEVARDFEAIGFAHDKSIEAFKHKRRPVWGVTWHPERMRDPVLPKELKRILSL